MEPPVAFDPDAVRDEKLKVLKALRYIPASDFERYVVRAQYAAGLERRAGRARLPPGAERQPDVDDRDVRGAEAVHRLVALGRRAVLPALGQAAAEAGHRDRGPLQGGAAPAVRTARREHPAERARRSGSSPTRGSRSTSGRSCPARRWRSRRSAWSSATGRRSASSRPRPTSGCCSTACSATGRCSRAPTRWRRAGPGCRASTARWAEEAAAGRTARARRPTRPELGARRRRIG